MSNKRAAEIEMEGSFVENRRRIRMRVSCADTCHRFGKGDRESDRRPLVAVVVMTRRRTGGFSEDCSNGLAQFCAPHFRSVFVCVCVAFCWGVLVRPVFRGWTVALIRCRFTIQIFFLKKATKKINFIIIIITVIKFKVVVAKARTHSLVGGHNFLLTIRWRV